jgi:hypothetical protein
MGSAEPLSANHSDCWPDVATASSGLLTRILNRFPGQALGTRRRHSPDSGQMPLGAEGLRTAPAYSMMVEETPLGGQI